MKGRHVTHTFDKQYWDGHWRDAADRPTPANPYLQEHLSALPPGTALDAGCGTGAEAVWLAGHGWRVTGADLSPHALREAAARATQAGVADQVSWVEADLTTWEPDERFDLVVTNYAHPETPQLDFYRRIADWVTVGGTLLIVGHLHGHVSEVRHPAPDEAAGQEHGHDGGHAPEKSTVTLADTVAVLDPERWRIDAADERHRTVRMPERELSLHDLVVRATRLA